MHAFVSRHKYGVANDRDLIFAKQGFSNWKVALEREKGFNKHASSHCHLQAAAIWTEMKQRQTKGETVACLLGSTQIQNNRYYVKSIGKVIQFLTVNELALHGSNERFHSSEDKQTDISTGLFLNLYEYTLTKDKKLSEIAKTVPKNAKYTSKGIQNQVIDTLATLVLQEVKSRYEQSDTSGFCI